ncbi:MAG: hypothetical protein ACOCRZ_02230, partial [Halothermotrichaceae bacterium]
MKKCILLLVTIVTICLIFITVGAADKTVEGGKNMQDIKVISIPDKYKKAVRKEIRVLDMILQCG